jgi:hypothetical protein
MYKNCFTSDNNTFSIHQSQTTNIKPSKQPTIPTTHPITPIKMQPPFPSLTTNWHNSTYPAISPTLPNLSLVGKTIMITGGGRGIGNRVAHALASADASLIGITGRTAASLSSVSSSIKSLSPATQILTFPADVLDEPAMTAAFEALKAASPNGRGIDILVHNAGYFASLAPIGDANADTEDYWKTFETNIRGSYITTRAFLKTLRPKDGHHEPILVAMSTAGVCVSFFRSPSLQLTHDGMILSPITAPSLLYPALTPLPF